MRTWSKLLLGGAALLAVVPVAQAATIPVTTTADVFAQDGQCSLREAFFASRGDQAFQGCPAGAAGLDEIRLPAGVFFMSAGAAGEDGGQSGDFDSGPLNQVRIVGAGKDTTIIDAAGVDRAFDVFSGASLSLADLTVRNGAAPDGQSGGAVRNKGSLTVLRVAFINDAAGKGRSETGFDSDESAPGGGGGAIVSEGQLLVSDAQFSGTRAGDGALGTHFEQATPTGTQSRDTGPTSGGSGGAILVSAGTATLTNITVVGARAGDGGVKPSNVAYTHGGTGGSGGAIAVTDGSATVTNGTFVGNRAGNATPPRTSISGSTADPGSGGAAAASGSGALTITFSTFSGNAVGTGPNPGLAGLGSSVSGGAVGASILADVGACAVSVPASMSNVVLPGDVSCPGARVTGDPRLGALGDNGGAVSTMAPGAGSPAIDVVVGVPCPATDARGQVRPRFAGCDAGAFEVQPGTPGAPGAGAGGGARRTLAPGATGLRRISGVTLSRTSFRTKGKKPLGTTLGVRLTVSSRIVLTVTKPATGRRSRGRCVAPTGKLAKARKCTRQVPLKGSLSKAGTAGLNTIAFSGKLRGKALSPGPYTFVLTLPKLGAAKPVVTTKGFRVIP